MRRPIIALTLALAAAAAAARAEIAAEVIPPEVIQQIAPSAIEVIKLQFPDPPVKVNPNAEKSVGYHVKQMVGLVAMPDRDFTAAALDAAADREIPVGVLATKSLSIEDRDAVVNGDRLAVADLQGLLKLPIFFLAARAQGADRMLIVYSRDGRPVLSLPLKKQAGDASQPLGLKISNINLEKKKLDATLSVGGAYEGTLKMAFVEI